MKLRLLFLSLVFFIIQVKTTIAQDLNAINGSGFNIATNAAPVNAPENVVISGIQSQFDVNYKWQLVNANATDNYYLRRYTFGWSSYYKIWHSGNFNPSNFLGRTLTSLSASTTNFTPDTFTNGYTFAYANSGTPWNGSLISFGGFTSNYDTQINADYGPDGGKHISFRTKNGDTNKWNVWNEFYHSGNLNKADVDFTAKTINSTNIYNNGNLWSKQITVAMLNPWADYVFDNDYILPSLSEVKLYIEQNHHLSEMPSAAEIKTKGLNISEINRLLTKKVEELTLYLIEKDKELNNQETTIKSLEKSYQEQQVQLNSIKIMLNELKQKN